jgi:hypothetical protein
MARFLTIVLLLQLSLIVVALVDCLSAEPRTVRTMPRGAWIFLILLTSPLGAFAWFLIGKSLPAPRTPRSRPRPLGPEDDPAFIASLATALGHDDK